jgi:hypothetical protein
MIHPYEDLVKFWLQAKYEESKLFKHPSIFLAKQHLNHVLRSVMALEKSLRKTLEF